MRFRDRTDAAMQLAAALHAYRGRTPLVLAIPRGAVPVAAPESLEKVRSHADEMVCLEAPAEFDAVSRYYREFPQVTDDEVTAILRSMGIARRRLETP